MPPQTSPYETRIVSAFEPPASRRPSPRALQLATGWLERHVPVVIPTETVYGLAAPALSRDAVAAIFEIKGRPLDNPLIAHVADLQQLDLLGAELTPLALRLARRFWPGPLTLVLRTRKQLPWVTAGLDSIAVRQPAHELASALIRRAGPLAAPSANLSGLPSPTRASHVVADLSGRVPLILDGGDLEHGLESTVVDARSETPALLRPGAVSAEDLGELLGCSIEAPSRREPARSPGMKYRHYSPRAEVWLYAPASDPSSASARELASDAAELAAAGQSVAVIARRPVTAHHFIQLPADQRQVAKMLFIWLRELDALGVDRILVEGVERAGIGRAVMDRLERAASRLAGGGGAPPREVEL